MGRPTVQVRVKGAGFGIFEMVDVYFDLQDLALVVTDGFGTFSCTLQVPKEALPAIHWITAGGRSSGLAAQKPFTVRTNWSMFHYGPQHRGFNPYENVLSPSNVAGLNELWRYTLGGSTDISSPALVNLVLYIGSKDHKVYALKARTGTLKWSYTTGDEVRSSPAAGSGTVYFGSYDGNLYALNTKTGTLKWSYPTGGIVHSSPALAQGVVYFGSYDGNLYALNAETGSFKWSYPTGGAISSSPAVVKGVVYVGSWDGTLYALNAETGSLQWSYPTGAPIWSSPAVATAGSIWLPTTPNSMSWMPAAGPSSGATRQRAISPPPRQWPMAWSMWDPTRASCML